MDRDQLPWNDEPADDDVVPGAGEPDPAEVEGDEDDDAEVDLAYREPPDPVDEYREESLDQRLSEEEPDVFYGGDEQDPESGEIQAATGDQDDISLDVAEPDQSEYDEEEPAEESAVHVRRPNERI